MKEYNPSNWYWFVGGDLTKVYSSLIGDYIPVNDPTFVEWSSDGTSPTRIDTEQNLGEVLAPLLIRPVQANVLEGYQSAQTDHVAMKLIFKLFFNHENRIRALEGKTPITVAQARAFVKGLM